MDSGDRVGLGSHRMLVLSDHLLRVCVPETFYPFAMLGPKCFRAGFRNSSEAPSHFLTFADQNV